MVVGFMKCLPGNISHSQGKLIQAGIVQAVRSAAEIRIILNENSFPNQGLLLAYERGKVL